MSWAGITPNARADVHHLRYFRKCYVVSAMLIPLFLHALDCPVALFLLKNMPHFWLELWSQSCKELEVFGWSRIPKNTRSRSLFFI